MHIGMRCVHRCAWEACVLLRGPGWSDRMPMASSDVRLRAHHGFKLAWPVRKASSLHMLKLVLREQWDAVSQRNVGSGKACIHACAFIPQSGLVEAGFHLGRERVGGWVQKRTKRGQTLKACPVPKGGKQKQPRGRRFNQD